MNSIPTPMLKDLLFAYFEQSPKSRWGEDWLKDYIQVAWVRGGAQAIALAIKSLQTHKQLKTAVYLPAYFCGDSLRFLRSMKIEFVFYELNSDFTPNLDSIRPSKKQDTVSIFLLVHFFGKYLSPHKAKDFCRQHGMVLIEDCAHLTKPHFHGHVGDFLVFSPHKHFGTKFGGVLLTRYGDLGKIKSRKINKSNLSWYLGKSLQSKIKALIPPSGTVSTIHLSNRCEQFEAELLDGFNLKLNQFFLDKGDSVVVRRQKNAECFKTFFQDFKKLNILTQFLETDQPYVFGVNFENRKQREIAQKLLLKNKVPCMIWPDIPCELLQNEALFSSIQHQVEKSLFLFCHQQLDVSSYAETLSFVFNNGKAFGLDI